MGLLPVQHKMYLLSHFSALNNISNSKNDRPEDTQNLIKIEQKEHF